MPPVLLARPNRGVFGGDEPMPGLSLLLSAANGYDSNVLAGQQGGGGFPLRRDQLPGNFGEGNGTLRYLLQRNQTEINVLGSSHLRYYPGLDAPASYSHSGSIDAQFAGGRRWLFNARQAASYASYNRLVFIPRGPNLPGFDAPAIGPITNPAMVDADTALDTGVLSRNNLSLESEFSAIQTLSRRDTIAYYGLRHRTETGFERRPLVVTGGGATYRRQLTRYGALRAGYGYTVADYHRVPPDILRMHVLDTGYEYLRPLSFSRRTTIGVTTGAQAFDRRGTTIYRALVSANVAHEIGRTWEVIAFYDRGGQYADIVDEPVYADTVRFHGDGLIGGQRLALSLDASYSNGRLTYTLNQNQVVTYLGSARLQWAFNEHWRLEGIYSYYQYEFGSDVPLPPGLLPNVSRQSVRVGLSFWLPIITSRGARGPR